MYAKAEGSPRMELPYRYENLDYRCRRLYDILTYQHNYALPAPLLFLANIVRTYMVLKSPRADALLQNRYICSFLYHVLLVSDFVDVSNMEGDELLYESDTMYQYRNVWLRDLKAKYDWNMFV